ncbi:hypothetical protein J6590_082291 [Homalodisca vitripennis]|nr:hypothetical protein J6590_082291 [Homalodisca vitripennis]
MLYGLQPLQERRKYIDILFLYRLVNGFLDCPHLVSDIDPTKTPKHPKTHKHKPNNQNRGSAHRLFSRFKIHPEKQIIKCKHLTHA